MSQKKRIWCLYLLIISTVFLICTISLSHSNTSDHVTIPVSSTVPFPPTVYSNYSTSINTCPKGEFLIDTVRYLGSKLTIYASTHTTSGSVNRVSISIKKRNIGGEWQVISNANWEVGSNANFHLVVANHPIPSNTLLGIFVLVEGSSEAGSSFSFTSYSSN